ncbi:MAG: HlyD family efflux transporter periplasmic adaptor subunit [Firmicutes bacterium]|nr:HlyD family efflux transporter periplasmic adaptor subunit [Bacillota bacterium]
MNEAGGKKRKSGARARAIRKIVSIVLVLAVVLAVGVYFAQRYVSQNYGTTTTEIQSVAVTTGSIRSTVSGSGTLASEDVEEITYPSSVTLDTVYVSAGDSVSEGTLLASVNTASVITAMGQAQEALDELDEQIAEAAEEEADDEITTALAGRVMLVYAAEEDEVATVMYENGALLLLSLDGYLAVDLDTDALSAGDTVTVTDSAGEEYTGTVESTIGSTTILVADDGPSYGDTVTVTDESGSEIGSGELYIHSALRITGYAGMVAEVEVEAGEEVDAGDTLFTLSDTSYSANYDSLLQQREELEETLRELIALYKSGAIYADISGVVESVGSSSSGSSSAYGMSTTTSSSGEMTLVTISPDTQMSISLSVDETDILSLEVGQEAAVVISSISDETSYTGTVTAIDTTATSSGGVTQYTAVVTIDKQDGMLSGMSATVTITIEGVENALLLPEDAVTQTSTTAYVYTSYDETTGELGGMVEVTLGLSNGSYVEITDGLSEGDTVYYTESSSDSTGAMPGGMSDFSDMGGGMSDFSDMTGGGMSDMGGGGMSDMTGGGMSDMGGGRG